MKKRLAHEPNLVLDRTFQTGIGRRSTPFWETLVLLEAFSRKTGTQGNTNLPGSSPASLPKHQQLVLARRWLSALLVRRSKTLVEFKGGGSRNLFLVHDGDGETLLYLDLARRMPSNLSVVGIEPHRIPGVPLAHTSIEEMSRFYVGEIRRIQPKGPYLLGGLCAGGVIAFEMASQLSRAYEHVELLALLETAAPGARKRPGIIARQRLDRLTHTLAEASRSNRSHLGHVWTAFGEISRKLVNMLKWETMQRITRWSVRARFRLLDYLHARDLPWPQFLPELSVRQILESAEAVYVPKPLPHGSVVLVRARAGVQHDTARTDDTAFREIYADDTFGWRGLTDKLVVIDVDGGHSSMLHEPFVQALASALTPFVDDSPLDRPPLEQNDPGSCPRVIAL